MLETKAKTAFALWREACDLDLLEAADYLGMTKQMILYLEHGRLSDGRQCLPQVHTRKLMTAAFKGLDLKPWPI